MIRTAIITLFPGPVLTVMRGRATPLKMKAFPVIFTLTRYQPAGAVKTGFPSKGLGA